jgi:AraC-like DNA-binding protein
MRFNEFTEKDRKTVSLGPTGAKPGAPSMKAKIAAGGDRNNPLFSQDTLDLQKELKSAGADLGNFGPNNDGLDGVMGSYTRRAAAKFPEISKKFKDVLNKPNPSAMNIDTSAIQDPDFNKKLEKVADALGVSSKDLIAIFKQESGVNPAAVNPTSGATGLIQFMPDTAARLGTSTGELKKMSAAEQLDYVYKYFKMVGVKPGMKLGDLYMAVFMPKYVGADDNTVLGQNGANGFSGKVYAQNKGLDRNKDGTITVADVKSSVQRFA